MKTIVALCVALAYPVCAVSQVVLYAQARQDSVELDVIVSMNNFCEEPAGNVIIVQAILMGDCADPVTVTSDPFPMPDYMTSAEFATVVASPDPDRYFMYRAVWIDAENVEHPLYGGGDARSYDYCGLPDAVVARGFITWDVWANVFEPCPDACWWTASPGCWLELSSADPGWEAFVGTGQVVNIFGSATADGMPGAPCLIVSRVEPETDPAGCSAVPTGAMSWGTVKSLFR